MILSVDLQNEEFITLKCLILMCHRDASCILVYRCVQHCVKITLFFLLFDDLPHHLKKKTFKILVSLSPYK